MRPVVRNEAVKLVMAETRLSAEAGRQYALASEAQYKTKEIQKVFALYEHFITAHPDTQEYCHERNDRNYCTSIS